MTYSLGWFRTRNSASQQSIHRRAGHSGTRVLECRQERLRMALVVRGTWAIAFASSLGSQLSSISHFSRTRSATHGWVTDGAETRDENSPSNEIQWFEFIDSNKLFPQVTLATDLGKVVERMQLERSEVAFFIYTNGNTLRYLLDSFNWTKLRFLAEARENARSGRKSRRPTWIYPFELRNIRDYVPETARASVYVTNSCGTKERRDYLDELRPVTICEQKEKMWIDLRVTSSLMNIFIIAFSMRKCVRWCWLPHGRGYAEEPNK